MQLEDLGYNNQMEAHRKAQHLEDFEPGRITAEHRERYIVKTVKGDYEAEITGHLRFTAKNREDFPAVGDWVALSIFEPDFAVIHEIFPRNSLIKRQAVGNFGEVQVIAANIDYAFLVQAADRDFNINRLERYLTICNAAKVSPLIVLTKTDLTDESRIKEIKAQIHNRIQNVPVLAVSNETKKGYDDLLSTIQKRKTYCMLGSSGVGKSTLLNNLSGSSIMKTGNISVSTRKGKHVTSHRELIVLENGGILIDNPGMREVGIADAATGLETTFEQINSLAENCKYNDCTHTSETGCAVIEAVENEVLDEHSYENYLKLEKERTHFESSAAEKRKKDKDFGKMVKNFKKDLKKLK